MSNAANQAIQAEMGQTDAVRQAKRDLFEEVAHAHYLERHFGERLRSEDGEAIPLDEPMSRESFCRRNQDGSYFYTELNRAWWGFQAGFTAAALAGAKG